MEEKEEDERELKLETVEEEKEVRTDENGGTHYVIVDYDERTLHVPSLPPSTVSLGREDSRNIQVGEGEEEDDEVTTLSSTMKDALETTNSTLHDTVPPSERTGEELFNWR